MKTIVSPCMLMLCSALFFQLFTQCGQADNALHKTMKEQLYMDLHRLGPGKVTYEAVAGAHAKDLAVQATYGVHFLNYWVDESKGLVYCLSSASDSSAIRKTHAAAHGLLPDQIYSVTGGLEAVRNGRQRLFLDIHELGAGSVTARDVAGAHEKDLAVQQKYGVNFLNYWVAENSGTVMCLSEAQDSASVVHTHQAAHGLLPLQMMEVKQGQ